MSGFYSADPDEAGRLLAGLPGAPWHVEEWGDRCDVVADTGRCLASGLPRPLAMAITLVPHFERVTELEGQVRDLNQSLSEAEHEQRRAEEETEAAEAAQREAEEKEYTAKRALERLAEKVEAAIDGIALAELAKRCPELGPIVEGLRVAVAEAGK